MSARQPRVEIYWRHHVSVSGHRAEPRPSDSDKGIGFQACKECGTGIWPVMVNVITKSI